MFVLAALLAAAPPTAAETPLITREPDGSFVIHRAIVPDDPPADYFTRGLVTERCPRRGCRALRSERLDAEQDRRRDPVERAFEEAIDQAREARRRD